MHDRTSVGPNNPDGAVSISPDGRRYVARLVRGDVASNGVWMELVSGRLDSLDSAARYESVGQLFTSGLGSGKGNVGPHRDLSERSNPIRWLDETRIAFLWSDDKGIRQVVQVNLSSRRIEYLTRHGTQVASFDISPSGVVFYNAQVSTDHAMSARMLQEGFVVQSGTDAFGLIHGDISGNSMLDRAWNTEWFVQDTSRALPRKIKVAGRDVDLNYQQRVRVSPDGKQALVDSVPVDIPAEWSEYTEPFIRSAIPVARRDPRDFTARAVHQFFVVDLERGTSRPLWPAVTQATATSVEWSPDGRSVLLAPTFLPASQATAAGLQGRSAAVVDVATGKYCELPLKLVDGWISGLRWPAADQVEISQGVGTNVTRHRFRLVNGLVSGRVNRRWQAMRGMAFAPAASIRIEERQDIVTPPRLFAVDTVARRERLILDLNPGLTERYVLGRVEKIQGRLASGDMWDALLFYPVNYRTEGRYPLVMQSVYANRIGTTFTLSGYEDGAGLGPPMIAAYAAQLLANRGIAVLHMTAHMGTKFNTPAEAKVRKDAFEAAAEQLSEAGLVDREKIGLVGFSRNGYYVEYTLAHSSFPFAAAIAADNWDPSYFSQTLTGYDAAVMAVNGTAPFGAGLQQWVRSAPGFNVERINTPLRKVEQANGLVGVLLKWEIFSRLRYLKRPVEFYVLPDALHGAHATQNPAQILAIQQGTVDWFDFWLNGREDPDPGKTGQYQRWRALRALQSPPPEAGGTDLKDSRITTSSPRRSTTTLPSFAR